MNTFILIHNYYVEDHYPAQSVTPFQSSLSHADLMREIGDKTDELTAKRRIYDEKMQTFYARRRAVVNSEEYCKLYAEVLSLNKSLNTKLNSTPKKNRNEIFHQEIKAITARLDTCRDACRKLEDATLDGMDINPPESKFIIGDIEIDFQHTTDSEAEIQILTIEEWLTKNMDTQITISYHS